MDGKSFARATPNTAKGRGTNCYPDGKKNCGALSSELERGPLIGTYSGSPHALQCGLTSAFDESSFPLRTEQDKGSSDNVANLE